MKPTRYIPILAAAATALLTASCVKDTLYNTPHPNHGKITVTADWSARGEGIDIPATWTIAMGDYTGTETAATHAPDHLFAPGSYTLVAWNPAEGITVSGTTATVAPASGSQTTGTFIDNAPGWFFTHAEQVSIEKDTDYPFTAAMRQQVRELTLVVEPTATPPTASRRLRPASRAWPERSTSQPIPTEPLRASCCPSPGLPRGPMPASGRPRCGCWASRAASSC